MAYRRTRSRFCTGVEDQCSTNSSSIWQLRRAAHRRESASFPDSPLVKWLQRCAIWALDSSALDIDGFSDLAIPYLNLVADAGQSNGRGEFMTAYV